MSGLLGASMALVSPAARAQVRPRTEAPVPTQTIVNVEQPDAQRTREEFSRLMERYPPTLRGVLSMDPTLLGNQAFLAPYPSLAGFLNAHPEVMRNPAFFVGEPPRPPRDSAQVAVDLWRDVLAAVGVFAGFSLAIGLLVWLIQTMIDYRRWSRLAKVQTDVHTKLLDRFTANEDLLAYIKTPAGSKFLESTPIKLDAGPRSVGAPLSRILWSVQGGLVLIAGGIGLEVVSWRIPFEAAQPLHAVGILALAIGIGFVVSAAISYVISQRLGLIESSHVSSQTEPPAV